MNETPKNADDLTPQCIHHAIDEEDRGTVARTIRKGNADIAGVIGRFWRNYPTRSGRQISPCDGTFLDDNGDED